MLPVVFYHLLMSLCPGGFIGVDVFFAISGYLICGGIVRDLQAGSFSMASFYFRRIRRIFPAYFVLVLSVLAAGLILYHWARIVPLAQTALFSTFFSANLYFWLDMGYFQLNAHDNPLLHLWSLGVEEQFYIIVPIALLVFWRIRRKSLMPTLLLCFMASFALCVVLGELGQSTTAFYTLPTRGWELLGGALVAMLPRAKDSRAAHRLSVIGIGLLVFSFSCISTRRTFGEAGTSVELILPFYGSLGITPFPGWVTLPAIGGSLLLLRYGNCGLVGRLLCSRPLVGIGKISYSLYLWHWPVMVFAGYVTYERQQSLWPASTILAISFLTAYLSWQWVEMPVRLSQGLTFPRAFIGAGAGCVALAGIALFFIHTDGLRHALHQRANVYASAPRSFMENFQKFRPRPAFRPPPYPGFDTTYVRPLGRRDQAPSFCLAGDSHAASLAPGLDSVAATHSRSGVFLAASMHPYVEEGSNTLAQRLLEWAARHPDIRDIYLVGRWMTEYRIPDGIPALGDKGRIERVLPPPSIVQQMAENFRRTALWFARHGKRVFVFSCVPEYGYNPADMAARREIIPLDLPIDITREDYSDRQAPVSQVLEALETEGLITVIPLHSAFFSVENSLVMSPTGSPYYQDGNHLTPEGACYAVETIAPLLWGEASTAREARQAQ